MSSLRILHVVPYYERAWAYGGIPRLAAAMARGLARRGHRVTVCTTDACDDRSRVEPPPRADAPEGAAVDVRVFRNLSNRLAYHYQFFTPVGLAAYLRRHAASFDVGHLHACHNLPGAIAGRALRRSDVPYVLSPNGTAPPIERRVLAKRLFAATVGRHVLRGADVVVAATHAERTQLVALGVPEARIALVPNPIDVCEFDVPPDGAAFRRARALEGGPIVLFLGKLTPRKGVDVLLRAFARLGRRDCRLVIAGNDMGIGRRLDALAAALGISADVTRIGLLRGRDRLDALAAAHVVVYPSRQEVFGLVAVEALACGRPVVVANDSGCGEIVGRVGGGHIVPYGDVDALAGAIDSILRTPALWHERARSAGTRVRELFAADVVCEQLERVYGRVVRASRPPAAQSA